MSDQAKLSQEEIDALLRQGMPPAPPASEPEVSEPAGDDLELLSDEERDVLGEIGNISFGSASTALSTLLQQRVEITTPEVTLYRAEDLHTEFPKPYVMVSVEYTAGIQGTNALAIELQDAKTIADLMLGGDGSNTSGELQELHLSAVAEAMNQMMGGAATSMSTIFSRSINISPPSVTFMDLSADDELDIGLSGWVACVSFQLRVGTLIDSRLMQLLPVEFAKDMVTLLMGLNQGNDAETAVEPAVSTPASAYSEVAAAYAAQVPAPEQPRTQTLEYSHDGYSDMSETVQNNVSREPSPSAANVLRPNFAEFQMHSGRSEESPRNLSLILDVGLSVTVELGRTKRAIREILELAPGSVIELDKLAGEPVDIMVNDRKIAIGEVVVIDENFGVRVTDIVSPVDRVKKLQ